ncbi:MAG: Mut7-C RNAse domain-containing protein [Desulfobacterales bacterium]|nr:Mut7-C RNAse domain-containing protein [Desulfobacterales bacterium]
MKFAADRMLGKLAKWLRILGYDTVYSRKQSNDTFLALADDDRILLSRNTRLVGRMGQDRLVFVEANDPKKQLQALIRLLGLKPDPDKFFSRCAVCNALLEPIKPEDVIGRVPDHIWTDHNKFSECKNCGRIYWPGSHLARGRREIRRLLGE